MRNFPFQKKKKKGNYIDRVQYNTIYAEIWKDPKKPQQTTQQVENKIKILKYAMGNTYVQLLLKACPHC